MTIVYAVLVYFGAVGLILLFFNSALKSDYEPPAKEDNN